MTAIAMSTQRAKTRQRLSGEAMPARADRHRPAMSLIRNLKKHRGN